jgi:pantetheine-phosphate adenylyltransferase
MALSGAPKAIYAGSFDPITRGHMSIIARAATMFNLTIGVAHNAKKKHWLDIDVRTQLVHDSLGDRLCYGGPLLQDNCKVVQLTKLLAEYCTENEIRIVVRGLRNTMDFEYEFGMAHVNQRIYMGNGRLETVFMVADDGDSHISSSLVRELHLYNSSIKLLVPHPVQEYLEGTS